MNMHVGCRYAVGCICTYTANTDRDYESRDAGENNTTNQQQLVSSDRGRVDDNGVAFDASGSF